MDIQWQFTKPLNVLSEVFENANVKPANSLLVVVFDTFPPNQTCNMYLTTHQLRYTGKHQRVMLSFVLFKKTSCLFFHFLISSACHRRGHYTEVIRGEVDYSARVATTLVIFLHNILSWVFIKCCNPAAVNRSAVLLAAGGVGGDNSVSGWCILYSGVFPDLISQLAFELDYSLGLLSCLAVLSDAAFSLI